MADQVYIKQYVDLLITQYWGLTKAKGEIEAIVTNSEKTFSIIDQFTKAFDIDTATGNRLDIIGSWVGMPRVIPNELPKIFFGFEGASNTRGFSRLSDPTVVGGPFRKLNQPQYTDLVLNDTDYRFFIKCRIACNSVHAVMKNEAHNSIQDVVQVLFPNGAYVVDTLKMHLVLYVFGDVDSRKLTILSDLDLLPRSQGVYYTIIKVPTVPYFGFAGDPNARGFRRLSDPSVIGGTFVRVVKT